MKTLHPAIVAMLAWSIMATGAEPAKIANSSDDFTAARKQMIGAIPQTQPGVFEDKKNPEGNYIYEATSTKPLVESIGFKIETNQLAKGLTTVSIEKPLLLGRPNICGLYWSLKSVAGGPYWVGITYRSDSGQLEAPQGGSGRFDAYLNGRQLQCSNMSDPVQVEPGVWFAEAQAANPEKLKEGDEISLISHGGGRLQLLRLTLYSEAPKMGAHRWRVNPGPNTFCQGTSLGVYVEAGFIQAPGKPIYPNFPDPYFGTEQSLDSVEDFMRDADGRAIARSYIYNPLPVPLDIQFDAVVRGYYLQEAGRLSQKLTIQPHAQVVATVPFATNPEDPAYSITATVKAVNPPKLGWPAYDELAFFPGLRHLIPWENPFEYKSHLRVNLNKHVGSERARFALHRSSLWEGAFTKEMQPAVPPPADLKFTPRTVPPIYGRYNTDNDPDAKAIYLRRKFVLPEMKNPGNYKIIAESVSSEGTVYVNGKRLGNVRGFNSPLVGDATEALHPGENEIMIVVRGRLAITNPEYVNPKNPTETIAYLDAPGDCNAHLGMHGGVWLEVTPDVEVQDLKVDTSVRKMEISAKASIVNRRTGAMRLIADARVRDGVGEVMAVGAEELLLKPGETRELELRKEWKDPRLWSWKEPNLYVMSVELKDAASGKRIDLAKARFGFRESWMQADKLFFNGHQVRLKGGGADAPYTGVSKAYSQLERDAVAPDFSDEVGSLVTHRPTGLVNSSTKHNVERDIFWETCESNTLRAMKRKWNHPCIIAWDLSNEWFVFAPYSGCDMNQAADRFMSLNSAVDKADPSRWTFFNGDYDIGGRHYNISAHYMLGAARFGYEFDGHSVYMPDGAFLRPLDKDYLPGEEIVLGLHQNLRWKMGSKVLMDNENLWKVGSAMPPGTSRYAGEDVVLSPIVDESTGQMIWMWKQDFDSHRDLGAAVHSNHDSKPGTVTRAHMLQTFIMPDVAHHAFSGVKLERKYSILNDLFRSAQMSFRWRLVGPDGKISQQGADERKMNSAETHRSSLSFTAPKVSQRTTFMLELRLYSDGEFACGEDRDIEIWPDSSIPVGALARKIYLYDPKGDTAVVLKAALCEFESLKAITAPEGDPARSVVVIGEGALDKESAQDIAKLASFADAGGRILILAQKVAPQGLPARLALESREWTSQPYVRVPIHPIFSGNPRSEISSWDLHFWAPDRVSSRGAYTKPFGGSCITLVDAGDEKGLEWVQMMELYRGKGNYFLSQFPLVANYYQEPMARELLSSTLKYAGGKDLFRSPINKLGLIAQKNGELEQRLKSLRADYELLGPETVPASGGIYMVEGGIVPDAQAITVWKKGLSDGATIVLCNARPEDAAWIENLAGKHVRITVPKYRMWEGRGYRDGFDPLTAGLSHLDLFWKKYFWNGHTSESPEYIIEQYQNASAEIPAARELIFPGALLDLKVGSGRLVLDQRRLTTDQQSLKGMAKRNLATLLLGLNVAIAPAPVKPELPRDITLRPIDISPYANRALFDDVGEDGKGGWSDQGPDTDLRSFPTGEQDFHGVPFAIGNSDRSIIVLASENRPDKQNLPLEVTVPIASKVEGLYFLHSSAYSGGEVALYEIEYEDGKTIEIPLVSDENIRDWASYNTGDFPNDNETETVVAWTGTCKMFKKISAFMMLWVNPHPETPVKSVRFVNKRKKCVPMLIGMTAAIRRDPVETSANLARAQEILKDAKIKLEEKKNDIAKKLLNEAVSISPELMEAQEMLADICEKAGNEDELIRTYRRWTRANPHTPGPWNRLGELLEKRKDYKGALEAYKRSLEVEWNQPPIIEAKTRMDKIPRD